MVSKYIGAWMPVFDKKLFKTIVYIFVIIGYTYQYTACIVGALVLAVAFTVL